MLSVRPRWSLAGPWHGSHWVPWSLSVPPQRNALFPNKLPKILQNLTVTRKASVSKFPFAWTGSRAHFNVPGRRSWVLFNESRPLDWQWFNGYVSHNYHNIHPLLSSAAVHMLGLLLFMKFVLKRSRLKIVWRRKNWVWYVARSRYINV